jgi:glyoxylase-like metal-dependent hydrolase (beta-lactamase superfamily II)
MAAALRVGEIEIFPILENPRALFDPARFFLDWTPEIGAAHRSWLAPRFLDPASGALILCVQSYVFTTQNRTVLVDACVGNGKQGRRSAQWNNGNWPWLDNLAGAGFRPEDIDVVACTHLHVDHAGWNTRLVDGRWVPTFPNAEYLVTRAEMDALEHKRHHGHPQYRSLYDDSVHPVVAAGQWATVEPDHRIDTGLALEPSPGHTAGHASVRATAGTATAVAVGDMVHHPIQALFPRWNSRACEDADQARITRREFLDDAADHGAIMLPAHFPPSRVRRAGDAYRFDFLE